MSGLLSGFGSFFCECNITKPAPMIATMHINPLRDFCFPLLFPNLITFFVDFKGMLFLL
jgi:hypothetical protein